MYKFTKRNDVVRQISIVRVSIMAVILINTHSKKSARNSNTTKVVDCCRRPFRSAWLGFDSLLQNSLHDGRCIEASYKTVVVLDAEEGVSLH